SSEPVNPLEGSVLGSSVVEAPAEASEAAEGGAAKEAVSVDSNAADDSKKEATDNTSESTTAEPK
ncbi:MAG: hypothetical protein KDD56_09720, partial [Bdellovibrionales bacterium]|nr:hypothetical protein [Bdellovibrionales bacterium]